MPGRDLDEAALIEHCRARLAAFKVPVAIDVRSEPLPVNANGKVVKRQLQEELFPIPEDRLVCGGAGRTTNHSGEGTHDGYRTGAHLSLEEMDKQSFLHPYTALKPHLENGPNIIASGSGVRLTNTDGKQYIDGMAGLWCVNIGWGHREVVDAITAQANDLAYYHSFFSMGTEAPIRLADRLLRLVPDNMSKIFFGNSGSDANDTNVKLVWYYNNLRGKTREKEDHLRASAPTTASRWPRRA